MLADGIRAFSRFQGALLARSAFVMAVLAVVLLVWQYSENNRQENPLFFWVYLLIWMGSFAVAGYAGWPLARAALAATSPRPEPYAHRDDWWVRDGFVRTTAAFSFTVAVGMLFLVIPGLMVLMIYTFYPFLILDRRAKGFQSLAASAELTRGNRIPLLGLVLILATPFIPAGAVLFLWEPGPMRIVAFWVLATPALSMAAAIIATAYMRLTRAF